jgi:hypothetical protein
MTARSAVAGRQIVGKVRDRFTMQLASGKLAQRQVDDLVANKPKRFGII